MEQLQLGESGQPLQSQSEPPAADPAKRSAPQSSDQKHVADEPGKRAPVGDSRRESAGNEVESSTKGSGRRPASSGVVERPAVGDSGTESAAGRAGSSVRESGSSSVRNKAIGRSAKKPPKTNKPSKVKPAKVVEPAPANPVAQVAIDVNAIAVDRTFDYLVTAEQHTAAVRGARVRVRFAGRLVDGIILDRAATSDHDGKLSYLQRINGPSVLSEQILVVAQAVAARYAGTLAEVLRDAIPGRHARVESELLSDQKWPSKFDAQLSTAGESGEEPSNQPRLDSSPGAVVITPAGDGDRYSDQSSETDQNNDTVQSSNTDQDSDTDGGRDDHGSSTTRNIDHVAWSQYAGGVQLIAALTASQRDGHQAAGTQPALRVALTVAAADDPAQRIADLTVAHNGNCVVVVPDAADLDRFYTALQQQWGDSVARLSAAMSPSARYREFLRIRTNQVSVVLGTRNSVFAPVDNALVIVWDDTDESLLEPRAPGWHAREVALLRSQLFDSPLVIAGYTVSVEVARLVETGWMRHVRADRELTHGGPRVMTEANAKPDDLSVNSRIPGYAWRELTRGLQKGPVLVQVARAGYIPAIACSSCGELFECTHCGGTIEQASTPDGLFIRRCRLCSRPVQSAACPACGHTKVRAVRIGSARTAAELHAAFPDAEVVTSSSSEGVLRTVDAAPKIVVATIGAEPIADGKYQAAILLDGAAQLARSDVRTEEQLMRRWFNATALVKSAADGGTVVVTAPADHRSVQALVRADPMGWAQRELEQRQIAGLPPAVRAASIRGKQDSLKAFVAVMQPGPRLTVSTPIPASSQNDETYVVLVTTPISNGRDLESAIRRALAATPNRQTSGIRVRIDPTSLFGTA